MTVKARLKKRPKKFEVEMVLENYIVAAIQVAKMNGINSKKLKSEYDGIIMLIIT